MNKHFLVNLKTRCPQVKSSFKEKYQGNTDEDSVKRIVPSSRVSTSTKGISSHLIIMSLKSYLYLLIHLLVCLFAFDFDILDNTHYWRFSWQEFLLSVSVWLYCLPASCSACSNHKVAVCLGDARHYTTFNIMKCQPGTFHPGTDPSHFYSTAKEVFLISRERAREREREKETPFSAGIS